MAIKTASAKAKGRALQQWVCQQISDLLDIPWGPDELIASREAAQSGTDVRLIGEAKERFRYAVECKSCEAWSIPAWIEQAKSNQQVDETDWLLFAKRRRQAPVVIMDAERFFHLLGQLELLKGKKT